MKNRFKRRALGRTLFIFAIVDGLIGSNGSAVHHAFAKDHPSTSIVTGTCDDPREVVVSLNALTDREGGVITSFTTVDRTIAELTGGDFAIVVGEQGAPKACGELSGEGSDVYASLRQMNGSNLSGIAWLHARDPQTQVTLFLGQGLVGNATTAQNEEPGGPPEPPVEQTPEPGATATAQAGSDETTYTSPTYGYTITYDASVWSVDEDTTQPTDLGLFDYFVLVNSDATTMAEFTGLRPDAPMTGVKHLDNLVRIFRGDEKFSEVTVREDADGNPIRGGDDRSAYVAIDVTWKSDGAKTTYYARNWVLSGDSAIAMMLFQTDSMDYDRQTPLREALEAGVTIPD